MKILSPLLLLTLVCGVKVEALALMPSDPAGNDQKMIPCNGKPHPEKSSCKQFGKVISPCYIYDPECYQRVLESASESEAAIKALKNLVDAMNSVNVKKIKDISERRSLTEANDQRSTSRTDDPADNRRLPTEADNRRMPTGADGRTPNRAASLEPTTVAEDPRPTTLAEDPRPTTLAADPRPTTLAADPRPTTLTEDLSPTTLAEDSSESPVNIATLVVGALILCCLVIGLCWCIITKRPNGRLAKYWGRLMNSYCCSFRIRIQRAKLGEVKADSKADSKA